jgi:futalosine hydrolase
MKILLVFPTQIEANGFVGKSSKHTIDVLISGIASYATIFSLTKHCLQAKPDIIIHAGICGTFSQELKIGDVVQVTKDCFADVGVYDQSEFCSLFDMNFIDAHTKPFTNGFLKLQGAYFFDFLPQCTAVTVNTITSSNQQKAMLQQKYNPQIESMEGAAVHYVCLQENIPCIHIRAISNRVGERNKQLWNIPLAFDNMHKTLGFIINALK